MTFKESFHGLDIWAPDDINAIEDKLSYSICGSGWGSLRSRCARDIILFNHIRHTLTDYDSKLKAQGNTKKLSLKMKRTILLYMNNKWPEREFMRLMVFLVDNHCKKPDKENLVKTLALRDCRLILPYCHDATGQLLMRSNTLRYRYARYVDRNMILELLAERVIKREKRLTNKYRYQCDAGSYVISDIAYYGC